MTIDQLVDEVRARHDSLRGHEDRRFTGTDSDFMAGAARLLPWRKICKLFEHPVIQRRHPGWSRTLAKAAVFQFEGVDFDKMTATTAATMDKMGRPDVLPPLPFPSIAIVHDWQFFAVDDLWLDPGSRTFGAHFMFLTAPFPEIGTDFEIVHSARLAVSLDRYKTPSQSGTRMRDSDWSDGVTGSDASYTTVVNGSPSRIVDGSDGGYGAQPYKADEADPRQTAETIEGMLFNLMHFLSYISLPTQFIVRSAPAKVAKSKKGRVPRLNARPQYIMLDKEAIQIRYEGAQLAGGVRKPVMPHLRRGHYRTLVAPRFRNPGQRVWVRATHVQGNTVEWREGDRFYKVV